MEKEFNYFEKPVLRCRDSSLDSQIDAADCELILSSVGRGMDDAPDLLRKSMERFLIGNVI